jgi:ABC-type transporter MlaC component
MIAYVRTAKKLSQTKTLAVFIAAFVYARSAPPKSFTVASTNAIVALSKIKLQRKQKKKNDKWSSESLN